MSPDWQPQLERWTKAGLLDPQTAGLIRAWEAEQSPRVALRWPILIALTFGAMLLGAGVLLFVSAHWDELSPAQRMSLVVLMVAVFHVAGAWVSGRFEALSIALHTVGTCAFGAAIGLTGQIFNLAAHWPSAVLLWALGAGAAWFLLRHWTQGALFALLVPLWLAGEADDRVTPVTVGLCAIAVTYLSAFDEKRDSPLRRSLAFTGGIALLPLVWVLAIDRSVWSAAPASSVTTPVLILDWLVAILGPLGVAVLLRGRGAVWNCVATAWVVCLSAVVYPGASRIPVYLWCLAGALGLIAWGVHESRAERINLGIAGFAITLLAFFFSNVMDKLNRSLSLVLLGLLFLGGGWAIERARRRLISRIRPVSP